MPLFKEDIINYLTCNGIKFNAGLWINLGLYNGGGSTKTAVIEYIDEKWILSKVYDDEYVGIRAETYTISTFKDLDIISVWVNSYRIGVIPKTPYTGKYILWCRICNLECCTCFNAVQEEP